VSTAPAFAFSSVAVVSMGGTNAYQEGRIRPLLEFLTQRARLVTLYIPKGGAEVLAPEFPGIEVRRLAQPFVNGAKVRLLLNYVAGVLSLIAERPPPLDCVVGVTGVANDAFAVRYLARRARAIGVVYVDNLVVRRRPGAAWWTAVDALGGRFSEWLYRRFDALFVNSPVVRRQLEERGIPSSRIILGDSGLDEASYNAAVGERPERDDRHCTFVGRINPAKGIFDLLKAWPIIIEALPGATLAVMGDGPAEIVAELRRLIAQTPGGDRIRYLGYVDGVTKYRELLTSKAFLLPSYTEMYTTAIREALVCGNAVVCYDAPGIREHYGGDVSLGPPGDYRDLARRTIEALRNPVPPLRRRIEISYTPSLEHEFRALAAETLRHAHA
jgi:glycosyltransferase involved in cell wall biosynthesis